MFEEIEKSLSGFDIGELIEKITNKIQGMIK